MVHQQLIKWQTQNYIWCCQKTACRLCHGLKYRLLEENLLQIGISLLWCSSEKQSKFHKLHLKMKTRVREALFEHIANNGTWVCHAHAAKTNANQSSRDQRGPAAVTCSPCKAMWQPPSLHLLPVLR